MKLRANFETTLLVASSAAVLAVGLLTLLTWRLAQNATQATEWVTHTHEVINALGLVRAETLQIEFSTQTYRVTGNKEQLVARDAAIAARERLLQQIEAAIPDNPHQQVRLRELREVLQLRTQIAQQIVELRSSQGEAAASAYAASTPLQETRTRVYGLLQAMDGEERMLLSQRTEAQQQSRERTLVVGAANAIVFMVLLGIAFVLLRRQLEAIRQSQRALVASEESLATTLYSIGDAVMATDRQGRVTRMNPVAEGLTGWTLAQALGQPIEVVFHILHEKTREPAEVPVAKVLQTGEVHLLANHTVLIAKDGSECPIADSAAPIRNAQGDILGVVLVFRDETDARMAKWAIREQNLLLEQRVHERTAQLRASEAHLHGVINSVPAMIAYVDASRHYVYANRQYRERFEPVRDSLVGLSVEEVLGPQRYAVTDPIITRVLQGQPISYDWEPFPGVWHLLNYLPTRNSAGEVDGYYVLATDITERMRSEIALRESEQRLERVLAGANQGYWDWDMRADTFTVSAHWESMLGYQPGEVKVAPGEWPLLIHPDDLPLALASVERHVQGLSPAHELELRLKAKDGSWRWVLTSGRISKRAEDGTPLIMSGTHADITERRQYDLLQREATAVFENSYEGIMVADVDGLITRVNPAFTRITGYTQQEVQGHSPRMLSPGRYDERFFEDFWQTVTRQEAWRGEVVYQRKNGEEFVALQSFTVVRDTRGQLLHFIGVFVDISHIKAHEAELDRVANYDSLTFLPNRRLLSDRLNQAILRADRSGKSCAICFLDLDGFKTINDQLGHAVGDQVLIAVSRSLTGILRADDTLARLGGDEFVVLLSEVDSAAECTQILERMLEAVRQPITVGERRLHVSASIGVSLYPSDNSDPDILLRHADMAMYLAKQAGKNRYQLFDTEIDREAHHHREILEQMRVALEHGEFLLFYQPKVDLSSGAVTGAEALIRWQQPGRGLLPPAQFLPHLHGSHLECQIGEWVIDTALRQMLEWREQGLDIKVSVNISAYHLLQPDFRAKLGQALARYPELPPEQLELEVLESTALSDLEQAVDILRSCMELGVRLSLDDFGTGYSSLTYLRTLPVHTLKIDQSFVRDMLVDPDDLGIVRGIIELAGIFNRQVVAEGVETLEHGAKLLSMGCRCVQGYGIARPMPASDMSQWSQAWRKAGLWLLL